MRVECLYCGKGIGPIRQLRDAEFCSDAHRKKYLERYRREVYEALAPGPAPSRLADFREGPKPKGPAPRMQTRDRATCARGVQFLPVMTVNAVAAQVERPTSPIWRPVSHGVIRPVLLESMLFRAEVSCAPFSATILPAAEPVAGPARTLVAAAPPAQRPAPVTVRVRRAIQVPHRIPLPDFAHACAPPEWHPAPVSLRSAFPPQRAVAGLGPSVPAVHKAAPVHCETTIALPGVPAASEGSLALGIFPADQVPPHPFVAGLLPLQVEQPAPVALDTIAGRNIRVVFPRPPGAPSLDSFTVADPLAAQPQHAAAAALLTAAPVADHRAPSLPSIETSLPTWEQLDSLAGHSLGLAPMLEPSSPQPAAPQPAAVSCDTAAEGEMVPVLLPGPTAPRVTCQAAAIGALARPMRVDEPGMQAAEGHRDPHFTPAPLNRPLPVTDAGHDFFALRGRPTLAPMIAENVASAAASPAKPRCASAPALIARRALVPVPKLLKPRLESTRLADLRAHQVEPIHPAEAPALHSRAALRFAHTLRVCTPVFAIHPVRVTFNDLLRGGVTAYGAARTARPRPSLQVIEGGRRDWISNIPKWVLMGAAAAVLLLAGFFSSRLVSQAGASRGDSVRQWLANRATREFADDFRGGLNQWKGVQPKWAKGWSYNSDGFIHPGQLALYRPSVPLSDYRFEFMAQIENKSVDWVVRARDADNYYALKFTVIQPGPRPLVAMVRYPVVEGSKGQRVETPLRMMVHANTPYRVTVDVKGNRYRAFIEGQEADFWTEDRLKSGGVGFFSEAGERARVYWVKVESHGDWLGRICGLLSGKDGDSGTDKEKLAMDYRHAGSTETGPVAVPRDAQASAATAQETRISRVLSKAAALHLDGKLPEAAAELTRALDNNERHPALYFALGQLQYEMQQYLPASQSYAEAALLQPLHPTAHFNTGVCLGRIERWEEAAESFRKAIANDPGRAETHLALAACLVQLERYSEAIDAYDRFLARHPDHDEALFGKAVALQKRDRSTEAVELYRRILSRNPRSEEALSNLVSLALSTQDYEQVSKYAQRLAEIQPKSQIALEGLAGAAFAAGDHQAAAEYSRKLTEIAPQVFENWFNLGVACHKAGDLPKAAEAYTRATKVQPNAPQAYLNLGVSLQEQGELKGARTAYKRALEIDPKLAGVHWNLGLVQEQLGDLQAAEKFYAQVPPNSPDADDAAFRIGHLRLQRADYPGSIQAFEGCLQRRPNWPEAKLNLGIAHWRAGDKEEAKMCFQELTNSGTDSREALRGLAALALEHQDYDKAFELYRQLLDSGERSPELLYNAGLICQRRGEPEDAAVLYKEALKADPQFGEALLNLGHALMSLGNEFEARSCWRKAVIAKPELAQRYFEPAQTS